MPFPNLDEDEPTICSDPFVPVAERRIILIKIVHSKIVSKLLTSTSFLGLDSLGLELGAEEAICNRRSSGTPFLNCLQQNKSINTRKVLNDTKNNGRNFTVSVSRRTLVFS